MKQKAFNEEDNRKDNLFGGWNKYLDTVHSKYKKEDFQELYEGIVTVSTVSKNRLGLCLENGRKIPDIPITPEISEQSRRMDSMYVALGRVGGAWLPLDVISIGNVISHSAGQVHITYNPWYMKGTSVH